jgi:hypothetical protein
VDANWNTFDKILVDPDGRTDNILRSYVHIYFYLINFYS